VDLPLWRTKIFIDTHTKKDGTPVNDEAAEKNCNFILLMQWFKWITIYIYFLQASSTIFLLTSNNM
jgi:hypothetical protein